MTEVTYARCDWFDYGVLPESYKIKQGVPLDYTPS
jgi:hypothetical protein